MCDEIDALTDRQAAEAEFDRRKRQIEADWQASQPAREFCADCEEAISPTRQEMRAIRCVGCQTDYERRRKLFGKGVV